MRPYRYGAGVLLCALAACSDTPVAEQTVGPQFSVATTTITGRLLGPDGTSLCTAVPAGTAVNVAAVNNFYPYAAATNATVTCPADKYSLTVNSNGSYYVLGRLSLTATGATTLPRRRLYGPVAVAETSVKANLRWLVGKTFSGGAYLDDAPFAGIGVAAYFLIPGDGHIIADGLTSTASGAWRDGATPNRTPVYLGAGNYYFSCALDPLGMKFIDQSGPANFAFPSVRTQRCDYDHSLAGYSLSHRATRLVTTADAGGIGSLNHDAWEGAGWGVQYPLEPGNAPSHFASDLFYGGLLLGFTSSKILSGIYMDGYSPCTFDGVPSCRDLGPTGTVGTVGLASGGRRVRWIYNDNASLEKVGLRVTQTSYDGPAGSDFVAFQYKIKNTSAGTISFYPGVFMDWDISSPSGGPTANTGGTSLSGQLMYVRSSSAEKHLGTLFTGIPVLGNHFRRNAAGSGIPFDVAAQYAALSGAAQVPDITTPGDVWYIHSGSQVTLAPGAQVVFWVTVIGGESQADIVANAKAAKQIINDGSFMAVNTASGYQIESVSGDDTRDLGTQRWDIRQTSRAMFGGRPACKQPGTDGTVAKECLSARPTLYK